MKHPPEPYSVPEWECPRCGIVGDHMRVPITTERCRWCCTTEAAQDLYEALRMILPLAEAYLKKAPGDPDNAKLETARAALRQAEGK